jgi:hypothetical protein
MQPPARDPGSSAAAAGKPEFGVMGADCGEWGRRWVSKRVEVGGGATAPDKAA